MHLTTLRQLFYELRSPTRDWLFVASLIFRTEWTEAKANGYNTLPHCCTQAGCWKHTRSQRCACRCIWCKIARLKGR